MTGSPLVVPPRGRAVLGDRALLAALALVLVGLGLLNGLFGAAVALLTAGALALGGPLLAYLVGTVALLGVAEPGDATPYLQHLLLATLLAGAVTVDRGPRLGLLSVLAIAAVVGAFVGIGAVAESLLTTAAIVAGLLISVSYVLHRYELLTLDLIDE